MEEISIKTQKKNEKLKYDEKGLLNLNFELKTVIELLGRVGYEKYQNFASRKFGQNILVQYPKYYDIAEATLFSMLDTGEINKYFEIKVGSNHGCTVEEQLNAKKELAVLQFLKNEVVRSKNSEKDFGLAK